MDSQEEHEDRAGHGMSPGAVSNDIPIGNGIAFTATSDGRILSPLYPNTSNSHSWMRRHRRASHWSFLGVSKPGTAGGVGEEEED